MDKVNYQENFQWLQKRRGRKIKGPSKKKENYFDTALGEKHNNLHYPRYSNLRLLDPSIHSLLEMYATTFFQSGDGGFMGQCF